MIKGMQFRDDCVNNIATALRTKDAKQVGSYYDTIITSMKRHLNTNIKKESSLESLHYTMVVYWERVMLPNKVVKSKDSKGDTGRKPSRHHHQQQYRSDAGNNRSDDGALATAEQSTGKKKTKKKHKTAGSTHAPDNGTSVTTPTQSICVEEEDQNQIALPPPPTTGAGVAPTQDAGAVASSGPLPVHLIKVRLIAASNVYLAVMKKQKYSGAVSMTLPPQTSLVDMLAHLERTWQRAMPSSSAPALGAQPPSASNPTAGIIKKNDSGENDDGVEKRCCLYLEAGSEASAALQGIKWGGPNCNLDLTIGDIIALLPTPSVDGELITLYYSWDLSTRADKRDDDDVEMHEVVIPDQQQHVQNIGGVTNTRGIASALPGEDAHDSLRRALKAALDHASKLKEVAATEAATATAKAKPAHVPASQPITESPDTGALPKATSIGRKRQRTELEMELENALNSELDVDGVEDAMATEQQHQQQLQPHSGALDNGGERSAQRARVPVGLRNLLTVQPPGGVAAAPPGSKTKAKKSPKKKAASTRKKKGQVLSEPSAALQSAHQMQQQQQQQQHMHAVLSQQLPSVALVGGMPLPAEMANYLQWTGGNQAQTAQVLQGQQQMVGPYMQFGIQQHPQLYAPMQQQQLHQQQQMLPAIAQPPQASPQFHQGLTSGMNSLFGDSMFKSIFETPLSNHPQQQEAVPKEREADAMPMSAANDAGFAGALYSTPGKEPRTSPRTTAELEDDADGVAGNGVNNTISKLPIDWACLSPPPNFKLPPNFGTGGGTPGGRLCGLGGASLLGVSGNSLLPSTSLLGFMDAHPKAQGAAATVMQKGVEALFQQVGDAGGGGVDEDETLAAQAAACGGAPPIDTSLQSIDSLLNKSNSNWLAPFENAQGTATAGNCGAGGATTRNGDKKKSGGGNGGGQQEDLPLACNRPFAALFGS